MPLLPFRGRLLVDFTAPGSFILLASPGSFGEADFELLQREQKLQPDLPLLCAVRPDGSFDPAIADAAFAGRWVKEADRDLTRALKERDLCWHAEQIRHEYPFCVRSDDDALIQLARPAWGHGSDRGRALRFPRSAVP